MKRTIFTLLVSLVLICTLSVSVSAAQEKESNDTIYIPNDVRFGEEINGTISSRTDYDWYRFVIPQEGQITVAFTDGSSDSYTWWRAYLLREDGETTLDGSDTVYHFKDTAKLETCTIGLRPGTYYVKITPYIGDDWKPADYKFRVNFTPSTTCEQEFNNSKTTATVIQTDITYQGTISSQIDEDWYKLTLTQDMKDFCLSIQTNLKENKDYWKLYAYQDDATKNIEGFTPQGINGSTDIYWELGTLKKGTYYFKVAPYSPFKYSDTVYKIRVGSPIGSENEHVCTPGELKTVSNSTCSAQGEQRRYCLECGLLLETVYIPTLNHTPSDWVEVAPTCVKNGSKSKSCDVCGQQLESITLPAQGHTASDWIITEPTCTIDGSRAKSCTVCGEPTESYVIRANGHAMPESWDITEPGCGYDGSRKKVCTKCGFTEQEIIPGIAHNYTEWKVISGSKLLPPIVMEKTCLNCNDVQRQEDNSTMWMPIALIALIVISIPSMIVYFRSFFKKK